MCNTDDKPQPNDTPVLGGMLGHDPAMRRVYEMIEAVAATPTTVLITGESGTGKSMVARAVHQRSRRTDGPYVTFACGSIPETLLESELFGHVRGAFTGAERDRPGKLLASDRGTLFIDEINSATAALQLKLLRVLQERQFEPVGSHHTVEVDARFVLATNQPLATLVKRGLFRDDLYYRINVVNIELPPLRNRPGDIPLLVEHFLNASRTQTRKPITGVSVEAMAMLLEHQWPGNVRELANAIERAVVLARTDEITPDDLPEAVRNGFAGETLFTMRRDDGDAAVTDGATAPPPGHDARAYTHWPVFDSVANQPLRHSLQEPERLIILAALRAHNGNRRRTAAALEIDRSTLYKKIKQYGLEEARGV
ncbi:MAG: AAA domain-containing protein [Phycisphaera sp.]|nr:AAA domain-containing protein [Phycisphaera sp.]